MGQRKYEILAGGKTVIWNGEDGLGACVAYANAHPATVVTAWREVRETNTVGIWGRGSRILQPGDRGYSARQAQ